MAFLIAGNSDGHRAEGQSVKSVNMRAWLIIFLVSPAMISFALAVAPRPSPLEQASNAELVAQLIEREKSSWSALQRHDKQAWESLLSDTYSHVNANGMRMDRAAVLNLFEDEAVDAFSLHDMRGTMLCPDVVLLAYWIERRSKFTGAFTSDSIWIKRSGSWLRLHYHETAMSQPPSNPRRLDALTIPQPWGIF